MYDAAINSGCNQNELEWRARDCRDALIPAYQDVQDRSVPICPLECEVLFLNVSTNCPRVYQLLKLGQFADICPGLKRVQTPDAVVSSPPPPVVSPTPSPTVASPTPSPTVASPTPSPAVASPTPSPAVASPTPPPQDGPTENAISPDGSESINLEDKDSSASLAAAFFYGVAISLAAIIFSS